MLSRRALLLSLARGEPTSDSGGTGGTVEQRSTGKPPAFPTFHRFHPAKSASCLDEGHHQGGMEAEIDERAALAADSVPACYLDAWARFQCQRPCSVDFDAWWQAIVDAGLFLDAWGAVAATMQWTAGELFDVPRADRPGGLVWQLRGERVMALGEDHAGLTDGHIVTRGVARSTACTASSEGEGEGLSGQGGKGLPGQDGKASSNQEDVEIAPPRRMVRGRI